VGRTDGINDAVGRTDGINDAIVGVGPGDTSLLIGIRSGPRSIAAGFPVSGDIDGTIEVGGVNGIIGADVVDGAADG
jgi:hypothetical protein